ncbi:hypothetical protein H4S08_002347, partial [Coemansia sp. RSA 1365]
MASPPLQSAATEQNKTPAPSTPPLPPTTPVAVAANNVGTSFQQSRSAPPKPRTSLLNSPYAAQRNSTTMEAFRIARTLKEGFARLKARAEPGPRLIPPDTRLRTLSATTAASKRQSAARQLARHHSLLPHYGSFSSDASSNATNG